MADYRPYDVRRKAIEDEIAMKLASEEAADKAKWEKASQGIEAYNANLPSAIGPSGYRRPQGQTIEPYQNFQLRIAKNRIASLQEDIVKAKADEERQLALKSAETTIKKGEAETGKAEEEIAGAKQTRGIIENLRKSGALGMEKGQLTTRGNYELTESEKLDKNIIGSQIKDAEKTIKKIDEKDPETINKIITDIGATEQYIGMPDDYIVNSIRNQLKIKTDTLKKQYGESYNESVARIPAETTGETMGPGYGKITNASTGEVLSEIGTRPSMPIESLKTKVAGKTAGALPEGLTEVDIQGNMKKYGKTREEVIAKYKQFKGIK